MLCFLYLLQYISYLQLLFQLKRVQYIRLLAAGDKLPHENMMVKYGGKMSPLFLGVEVDD